MGFFTSKRPVHPPRIACYRLPLSLEESASASMPHPQIKFGTDGWRGIIADDFTFANVRIAAEAIAAYIHAQEDPKKGLSIAYDTRFASKAFARACAEVVAATGIPVQLANAVTPTPALSFGVR
jgi:phosphomannomutase